MIADPRIERVLAGEAVVANRKIDGEFIAWAHERGLYVYVGRPSIWGNPFQIGRHGSRDEVIAAYREHLDQSPALKLRLHELRGKVLGCWCHPEPCHADVLCDEVAPPAAAS